MRIHFNEIFAPIVRMKIIRIALIIAVQLKLQLFQLDVKSTFLNEELEEEAFVEQSQGFMVEGHEDKV